MKRLTREEFIKKAISVHGNRYDYSKVKYINCRTKVCIICPKHGEFYQLPSGHLHGAGCEKCARESNHKNLYLNNDIFIEKSKLIHGDKYDYSLINYQHHKIPIVIICPEHGEFLQKPVYHLQGNGCPKCKLKSQSKLLEKLSKQFPKLNFIFEATNKDIPWAKQYRFDIYNKEYNFIVEYDGELHFISKSIFGGEDKLKKRQELDLLKNKLCEENNCNLFRIKYGYTDLEFTELVNNINNIIKQYEIKR